MVAFIIELIIFIGIFITLWRFKFKARFLPVIAIILMVGGIASLCQPWIPFLYHYGLGILMLGVFSYILVSHFE